VDPEDRLFRPRNALAAAAALAIVLGLSHGSAGALAFGGALALLLLSASIYARVGAARLAAFRDLAPRAFEDDRVDVRFRVENRSSLPLYCVEIEDHFPADRVPAKRALVHPRLGARQAAIATYRADCDVKRGPYAIGPVIARAGDPLGLVERPRVLDAYQKLVVYPRAHPVARIHWGGGGLRFDVGALESAAAGAGLEFLGTREYRPGDCLRFIHWPSTARAGRIIVKEFEEVAAADVAVFLDLHRFSLKGLGRVSTLEYAIRIAASVAVHVARGRNRLQLHARGARPVHVPKGAGEVHLARILHELAHVRADGETPFARVLRETAPLLDPGATAVPIFTSLDVDLAEYADILALYRAHRVRVVAVLIDDGTFLKLYEEQEAREREAPTVPAAVAALLAEGATVYTVARQDDISTRLDLPYSARFR